MSTTKLLAAIMFGAVNVMGEHMGSYGQQRAPSSSYVERTTARPTYEPTPQPTTQYNPYKPETTQKKYEPETTQKKYEPETTQKKYEPETTQKKYTTAKPEIKYTTAKPDTKYIPDTPYQPDNMCYDAYNNNPCTAAARIRGQYHFPSCKDKCNFIQCDESGNAYDMPCAPGTIWDPIAYTCNHDLNGECPKYTPPDTTYEKLDKCHDTKYDNPCTPENIAAGHLYHPSCTSCCDFIQCDASGKAFDMPCAEGTVWDPIAYTCNYNYGQCDDELCHTEPEPEYTPKFDDKCYDDGYNNPCTKENRERGQYYFKSCNGCCNFIQCDESGQAFERQCAAGTYWDQDAYACNFNYGQCKDKSCAKKKVTPSPTQMKYEPETTQKKYEPETTQKQYEPETTQKKYEPETTRKTYGYGQEPQY